MHHGSNFKFWFFLTLTVLVAYLGLIDENYLKRAIEKERTSTYQLLGRDAASTTEARAHNRFVGWFVEPGLVERSTRLVTEPAESGDRVQTEITERASPVLEWAEGRARSIWLVLYQFMLRISTAVFWWPFLLLCLIPFGIDAMVVRKIKSQNYDHASPHLSALAGRVIFWSCIGYPLLLLAPLALPAHLLPILIFLVAGSVWFVMSHFLKRW